MNKKRPYGNELARRLQLQYLLALLAGTVGLVVVALLARHVLSLFIWYPEDPLYRLFSWIKRNLVAVLAVTAALGWAAISLWFVSRPVRYLGEIVEAAEALAHPEDKPIVLPPAMNNIQTELNLFREQALRNVMAAKEAEQQKNDLIVYLAHDLKTPLTSVIGYLTLLRDEPEITPELRARYTGIALNKAERLESLMNEFFEITRFNLTGMTLETSVVNLSRMLEQISYEFNPALAEKRLGWDIHISPDVEIICDPEKLERVFDNLLRNAVNYSYAGSRIRLSLEQHENEACITVHNHGRNIPPEKLNRIFDQFYRLDTSRASSTGGSGLGLAIAKEIVELHGGVIKADSFGENVLFTVTLPVNCQKTV